MRSVAARIAEPDAREMCLTVVSEAELPHGVTIMSAGKRRNALEAAMALWLDGCGERILPFDSTKARGHAEIATDRRHAGRPIGEGDCQIAAICRSRGAALVTRNVRDVRGYGRQGHRSLGGSVNDTTGVFALHPLSEPDCSPPIRNIGISLPAGLLLRMRTHRHPHGVAGARRGRGCSAAGSRHEAPGRMSSARSGVGSLPAQPQGSRHPPGRPGRH